VYRRRSGDSFVRGGREMTASYSLVFVPSISHAVACEKVIRRAGIPCKLIPVPRRHSSDCGVCIRVSATDRSRVEKTLAEDYIDYERILDDS
jgi:hypothetical protein